MKFFVVEITYTAPLAEIDRALPAHRQFLQTGYDQKRLLFSGPQNPRTGGLVAARGKSLDDVTMFFARDPFQVGKLATYRIIEFLPMKFDPTLTPWFF